MPWEKYLIGMKKNKRILKLVFCSLFSALGIVMLWIGGALGDLDLTIAGLASLLILIVIIELNGKYALLVYIVTSSLSLMLFSLYPITMIYTLFVGVYPILKFLFEKIGKYISLIPKLIFMNLMLTALIFILKILYGIEEDVMLWIVYILANIAFLIFDFTLSKIKDLYISVLQKRIGIYKLFK